MSFDEIIQRTGTHSQKWDEMERLYGVSPEDGLPMWVADMEFQAAPCIQAALDRMREIGVYGYYGDDRPYLDAICWWMAERHGWTISPEWILTCHGLVNGTALVIDAFTAPGDGVVLMTPVYHGFSKVIRAANREMVECPLVQASGRYVLDLDAWEAQLTGRERLLILCSPHNPGGRVWTRDELRAIGAFCEKHDLLILADEIHHDLVFAPARFTPFARACPELAHRLITMTAPTKTFNIAGAHTGNFIIEDSELRATLKARLSALGLSPNAFGMIMTEAAYSTEGALWLDELLPYLDTNRRVFDATIAAIPGLQSMDLQATYLAWVDFSGTGMSAPEFTARVEREAKLAVSHGTAFGHGGESYLRFNIAMPRAQITEACARLEHAFSDLQ